MRTPLSLSLAVHFAFAVAVTAADFKPTAQDKIVPADAKLEMVWAAGEFTEGPTAAANGDIYFTDIGNRIMRFVPSNNTTLIFREPSGKANGLEFDAKGRLIACEGASGGGRRITIIERNVARTLADRWEGKRFNSPNDLALAPNGLVYFTDPRYAGDEPRELDFEGVFFVRPNGVVGLATKEVQKPNGILVSTDGKTVFVADNNPKGNRHLVKFTVGADAALVGKEVVHDFGTDRRGIDGMTLDNKGNIFATAGTGKEAGIYVFSSAGKHLAFVPTPGSPTNCAFGVGNDACVLYITAQAAPQADGRKPWALFRIRLNAVGHSVWSAPTPAKPE
ncbi:MAG: SMP-30/gluconolactonase/LRE family protein [Pedosphaera sp.]|nr:SMP-30/gluconolactonase/LRE family protein [Pedosphaera sp.]MSU44165.1 SMP-30/gluconolactonase/LRE family protein [Pedosphaera sp.]